MCIPTHSPDLSFQVPAIIGVLRTQAQFNTLISSCVRTNSLEDVDTSVMMEVTHDFASMHQCLMQSTLM